jgi:hypothetical protein
MTFEPFWGAFWGGQDFFDPLNCLERSEGQFRGQKSRGPLNMSREMAHKDQEAQTEGFEMEGLEMER